MSVNIRGAASKLETLMNIVTIFNIKILCLQETHFYGKNKVNLPGYVTFYKNREKFGSKGGVSISIQQPWGEESVLVYESKNCELIAVKICCTSPPTCVVNYYGAQENTTPAHQISQNLSEVFGLVQKLSAQGNAVVLGSDCNVSIGNSVLIDNATTVSRGGQLVNSFIDTDEDLELVNARYGGSSITHLDASGGRGKCLDFLIANKLASERITEILVDETKILTPFRYLPKSDTKVFTDHLAIYWQMKVNYVVGEEDKNEVIVWNKKKPLGNGKFAYHLDRATNKILKVLNDEPDINKVMQKVNKESDNAKFRSYGRNRMEPKTWDLIEESRIAAYRWGKIQEAIDRVKKEKKNHTVPLQVFAMRKSNLKSMRGEMLSSVKDPDTGKIVDTKADIFRATVRHNEIVLTQKEGQPEEYQRLRDFKIAFLEWAKVQDSGDPNDETIYVEEFQQMVTKLASRNKTVYDDMKSWGPQFRVVGYWLMKRMYEEEEIPREFTTTNLQPLYKGKGPRNDLSSYRFLHLKTCFAKLFEALVMEKVKGVMYAGFTESQVGGKPNSRTTEHLYMVVTMMLCFEQDKDSPDGAVVIVKDVVKAFDALSAIHTLFSTAMAGVRGKNLRLLELMNKQTDFKVVGDPRATVFTRDFVGGQGTVYMAPGASLTMPEAMQHLIKAWEAENKDHLGVRLGPEKVKCDECEFVDDQFSMAKNAEAARVKGNMITMSMDQFNVKVHPIKTKYMILGKKEYVEKMEKEIEENPIKIQGFEVERSHLERYLGMMVSSGGLRKTVEEQMKYRIKECEGKLAMIQNIMEDPTMRGIGHLAGSKVLFESILTSTALYSAGVWINVTKAMVEKYDRECKRLLYTMLKINSKTTLLHVCWELDIIPWSYGIVREKVSLATFLCNKKVGLAGMLAVSEARRNWKVGLMAEARAWCSKHGLPDPCTVPLSSECISERVKEVARKDMWESVIAGKYLNTSVKTLHNYPAYIFDDYLSNHQQKILFCFRLGILEFKSRFKSKFNNTRCIYSQCPADEDSLNHSLVCLFNPVQKPNNRYNLTEMLKYLEALHKERMEKVAIPLYYL